MGFVWDFLLDMPTVHGLNNCVQKRKRPTKSSVIDVLCVIYHAKEELTRKVVVVSLPKEFLS